MERKTQITSNYSNRNLQLIGKNLHSFMKNFYFSMKKITL